MVVGSFKEVLNLIILYQMMYITDWSKYMIIYPRVYEQLLFRSKY